ncbi:hypothetical protein BGZ76_011902 [Entomortierella beljakovae]|nr:hypothetical protein BGZ76_011902 [Entomortierella beljakovae]
MASQPSQETTGAAPPSPSSTTQNPPQSTTDAPQPTTTSPTTTAPNPPLSSDPPATTSTDKPDPEPTPSPEHTSGGSGGGGGSKVTKSKSPTRPSTDGAYPVATPGGGSENTGAIGSGSSHNGSSSKSIIGPIIGGIAGVLVLAFLVAVFVMRHRKKNKAKRRLDILLGPGQNQDHSSPITSNKPRPSSMHGTQQSTQVEMTAIPSNNTAHSGLGGPAYQTNDGYSGYEYQQGYQNVPYGGYQDQYDQYGQYDPYYQQPAAAQQASQMPVANYYPESQQQLAHQPFGAGSPAISHSSAPSPPKPFPQPPSVTGGSPYQQHLVPEPYDKQNKIESGDYASAHSPARNPQVIPKNGVMRS